MDERVPSEPGYSGSAPSPSVSASGEYPSRSCGNCRYRQNVTEEYEAERWQCMNMRSPEFGYHVESGKSCGLFSAEASND